MARNVSMSQVPISECFVCLLLLVFMFLYIIFLGFFCLFVCFGFLGGVFLGFFGGWFLFDFCIIGLFLFWGVIFLYVLGLLGVFFGGVCVGMSPPPTPSSPNKCPTITGILRPWYVLSSMWKVHINFS